MRRFKLKRKHSKRLFSKGARSIKKSNFRATVKRGGIRF